jgi:hypothetical protein
MDIFFVGIKMLIFMLKLFLVGSYRLHLSVAQHQVILVVMN